MITIFFYQNATHISFFSFVRSILMAEKEKCLELLEISLSKKNTKQNNRKYLCY